MQKILQKYPFLCQFILVLSFSIASIELSSQEFLSKEHSIIAPLASSSLLLDGFNYDGKLVVAGERGHILISSDGRTWEQAVVPSIATLTAVKFIDEFNGLAVGHDAIILRTSDGGKNWKRVYYSPEGEAPLLDIWIGENGHCIAIGAYGLYLVSEDNGITWQETTFNASDDSTQKSNDSDTNDEDFTEYYELHLNSLSESAAGELYIAAEAGRIYRSADYGDTWQELNSPYIGSLFGVLTLEDNSLLVFGLRGHLFRSDDSGKTWEKIETKTQEMLTNALLLADGTVLICGLGGTVLISEDGGYNFSSIDFGNRDGYLALILNKNNELITVGENGVDNVGNINTLK